MLSKKEQAEKCTDIFIKIGFDVLAFLVSWFYSVRFAIIVSLMGIFNLGHGEFVLLELIVFIFLELGLLEWTGMLFAPFFAGTVGLIIEVIFIRRMYIAPVVAMLATFAIGLIIRETVRGLIGGVVVVDALFRDFLRLVSTVFPYGD